MTATSLAINATCPWSGDPVAADSLTRYRGQTVGFCNPECRDKFDRATAQFDAAMSAAGPTFFQLSNAVPSVPSLSDAALIVIDAQEEYRSGALPLVGVDAALVQVASLLDAARAAGGRVFHIVHKGSAGDVFDPAAGGRIMAEVAPASGEPVIEKAEPSAFTGTDLAERLQAAGVTSIVLAGFMTHLCVSSTARAGMELGFSVTVAGDAAATRPLPDPLGGGDVSAQEIHRAALTALGDCFAGVVPTAAILTA